MFKRRMHIYFNRRQSLILVYSHEEQHFSLGICRVYKASSCKSDISWVEWSFELMPKACERITTVDNS